MLAKGTTHMSTTTETSTKGKSKMADKSTVTDLPTAKKPRKPPVRRPVELAVVVRVTDSNGNPITDGHVEILQASKDISAAFRTFKQNPSSDMVTFTLGEKKDEAVIERQAAE